MPRSRMQYKRAVKHFCLLLSHFGLNKCSVLTIIRSGWWCRLGSLASLAGGRSVGFCLLGWLVGRSVLFSSSLLAMISAPSFVRNFFDLENFSDMKLFLETVRARPRARLDAGS